MKVTLTNSELVSRINNINYVTYSINAIWKIIEDIEMLEDSLDYEMEFDGVWIRSSYTEYGTIAEALSDFGCDDIEELREQVSGVFEIVNGGLLVADYA